MHTINIKVDDDIYNRLYELAKQDDRPLSKYILRLIKTHATPPYPTKLVAPKVLQPATPPDPPRHNKYEGLTGDALMDAMDADSRKYYESRE